MQPGERVVLASSVLVCNHPLHRGEAFEMKGSEGDLSGSDQCPDGVQRTLISPTLHVQVGFGGYRAHFRGEELQSSR